MTMSDEQPTLQAVPAPAGLPEPSPYQPCDNCGAPLDEHQRYCVACGARRKHARDPAARFLAAATTRGRRTVASASPATVHKRGSKSAATAVAVAVLPLVLGAGVLIGRSSAGGDGKLIAALQAQKAPVIEYSGTAAGAGAHVTDVASASTTPPVSTFTLAHGYAVQLGTLPAGTGQAQAAKAERVDKAKGVRAVGLIAQSDFRVTPSPAAGDYVIYAGSYATQTAAQHALVKLKTKFPAAKVIEVRALASSAKAGGRALTKTQYGTAHQVTNYKPSSSALAQGSQVANQDSHSTGKAASGAGLPDQVAIP